MRDLTVFLAKVNSGAYGTDAAPTAAANAHLVFNYRQTPYEAEEVTRDIDRPFPGEADVVYTAERTMISYSTELRGSGAALTPAKWGELLRGSMFGAAAVGVSNVSYPLISTDDGADLTHYGWKDNARMRTVGVRGNAKFIFALNANPRIEFEQMGLLLGATPLDANAPTAPVLDLNPGAVPCNKANTSISLGGQVLGFDSFEVDLGMKTSFYETMSQQAVIFDKDARSDRRGIKFRYSFEMPDPGVVNFFADIRNQNALAFALQHGTQAGNIVEMASAVAKLRKPTFTTRQNRIYMQGEGAFVPTAANNELTLTTR
jgi:hypothetical protein